ncbi:4-hydroxybenzoate polyprenyltransferase, mitochondrial-like isoform X1 [Crassostrea virginica]
MFRAILPILRTDCTYSRHFLLPTTTNLNWHLQKEPRTYKKKLCSHSLPFCSLQVNQMSHLNRGKSRQSDKIPKKCVHKLLPTDNVYWRNSNGFHALTNQSHRNAWNSLLFKAQCVQKNDVVLKRLASLSPQGIVEASPPVIQPYMRLIRFDKPIGTWLLYWPCTWSIALATPAGCLPSLWLLALFGAGSFFMRGAGCIINDMWDKDFDRKVERTKLRPMASGEVSQLQGLVCLAGMLSVSLGILLQLNWYSVVLGAASMGLVITYPLAKRFTFWPQAFLGLTFNYGALLGWSAVTGSIHPLSVLPLYFSGFCWTMVYDTIYAHQDKYDDMLIGVKSTALKFGDNTKLWLTGFGTTMVSLLVLTGRMCDQTWPYYSAVSLTAAHIAHQLYTVDLNNPDDCAKKFRSNSQLGLVMFLGIVLGTLLKKEEESSSKPNVPELPAS